MKNRISRLLLAALACAASLLSAGRPADAASLWKRRDNRSAFLFADNRARRVGDLLTIMVVENTDIDSNELRILQKQTTTERDFEFTARLKGDVIEKDAEAEQDLEATSNRRVQTTAQLDSGRDFTDFISVIVVDVMPNGNLVVEGHRTRMIAGERRTLRTAGIVRPNDIENRSVGNVVESRYVANFRIWYEGIGNETQFTRPGWFSRFLNRTWPF